MQRHLGIWATLRRRAARGERRGVILILSCMFLVIMLGFAAFAIDLGYIVLTAQQLQNAADAACLSAILEMKTSDATLTRPQLKAKALAAAQVSGLYNYAGNRPVQIYAADMTFGNRSYNFATNTFTTTWEDYGATGTSSLNAVQVSLSYGTPAGGGSAPAGRDALKLFFAPVIGTPVSGVSGDSSSHLTPRDLVFVIDISGSMFGGCGGNQSQDAATMTGLLLGNIYTSTPFTSSSLSGTNSTNYNTIKGSGNAASYLAAMYPPKYPQRAAKPSLAGNYQALWNLAFNASTPSVNPNIDPVDQSDAGKAQEDAIDYITTSTGVQYSFEVGASAFGTTAQVASFLAQEFPDRNTSTPWTHWKWVAYCDHQYSSTDKNESKYVYYGTADASGFANTKNLNVPAALQVSIFKSNPATNGTGTLPGGSYVNNIAQNRTNALPANVVIKDVVGGVPVKLDYVTVIGVQSYVRFALANGYIPCVRGQEFWPRDNNNDDVMDIAPSSSPYYPQPTYMGFYPRTKDIAGFNKSLLYSGTTFNGVYPGDLGGAWMSYVRQGTLYGLNAMIEQEQTSGSTVPFNQVGMVSFGTAGFMDLDLTNNLDDALRIGTSRLTCYPGQPLITPKGSGRTNWGSGIREAVKSLTTGPRARNYAAKSIVFLSDGAPNFYLSGGYTGPEFNYATQTDNFSEDATLALQYGKDWATNAYNNYGITIHAVGFSIAVGGTADTNLQSIATIGHGVYKNIPGTQAGFDQLKSLFVDIAKDRLGQLYSGN